MFIDTHCHLDFADFNPDRDEVIKHSREEGIDYIINIGSSLQSSHNSVELAQKYEFIYATVGIHPHEADNFTQKDEGVIRELVKNKKVVAIGEIGLDYYKNFSQAKNQKLPFSRLAALSKECNLPLVIHCREAEEDVLKILKPLMPINAVVHCFSGSENFLRECLDLGFLVSFTCNITYPAKLFNNGRDPAGGNKIVQRGKKAQDLKEIVKLVPLEKILLETDAPYLSPEGRRGRRNEPLNVKYVANEIASIKELTIEEVAKITSESAKNFFQLK